MSYVDGYVIPVPADQKEAYREMAAMAAPIFLEHGATRVVECWGDDVPVGKTTDFHMAVKAGEAENVVFSWVVWPSKQARDEGNRTIMEDPRMKMPESLPMDPARMIFGGFEVMIDTDPESQTM